MDENSKIIGTVTIGADEYRELIEENVKNEHAASENRSKCWNLESDLRSVKKDLEDANRKLAQIRGFIESSDKILEAYKLYIIGNIKVEEEGEEQCSRK